MTSVLFFDDRGGFGPTWNATHPVGGAEIHLVQIAEHLAGAGCDVTALTHQDDKASPPLQQLQRERHGVQYLDSRAFDQRGHVDTLIVVGCASMPTTCRWDRAFAFQVVDPRPHPQMFDHLKGRATMVCVSEWQAGLFRALGHEAIVIPVPVPDKWYDFGRYSGRLGVFSCVASWNKGAQQTLDAWEPEMGQLAIGSSYSHPPDAEERCRAKGAAWLGELKGDRTWAALSCGEGLARVCTIGETFGVTDVFAQAMGMPTYTLCTGDVGALDEVGVQPFRSRDAWARAIRERRKASPNGRLEEFRASRVLPRWEALVNGS